ncbi:MAG TPA: hypothetical protein VF800_02355 [Telluria sp.]|jgi:hypothetical protein
MNKLLVAACAAAALGFSYLYLVPGGDAVNSAGSVHNAAASDAGAHAASGPGPRLVAGAGSMSPFGTGKPPTAEDPKQRQARLQEKMKQLGFFTPEKYYKFDLKTLKKMADTGDVFATLQLAEQFYSESEGLENDPAYDLGASPKAEGNKYLEKAATMGIVRAATLLSLRYQEEAKPVDAHAWSLISQKFGDKAANVKGYGAVKFPTDATSIKLAQAKVDEIMDTMLRTPNPRFPQ